jgi:hypothetical protein
MKRKRMPKSLRKYIRQEKARIRREVLDITEQEKQISQIYQSISKKIKTKQKHEDSGNLQSVDK